MMARWNNLVIPKRLKATLRWTEPYAAAVHQGRSFANGSEFLPRPWVYYSVDNFPFIDYMKTSLAVSRLDFKRAFVDTASAFGEECQVSIKSSIWQWDRQTVRRSGEVVTSPRNIFDLGNLFDSFIIEYQL